MQANIIYARSWLDNGLPDKCADLIIADPPYYKVKGEFDFSWRSMEEYLEVVERWAVECARVLKDNGTLLWWGHPLKIAYSQVILDKYFNLLNSLVWEKVDCQTRRNPASQQRRFVPVTERLLLYDKGDDKSGWERIYDDPALFYEIKKYFDDWHDASGLSLKEVIQKVGSTASHYLGFTKRKKTQFQFPTREKWEKMGALHPHSVSYEELRARYEELRARYEELRRYFNLSELYKTDVLRFSQESFKAPEFSHPTKKPETLTRYLIETTCRPGGLVVVPFAGSGTECAMALATGRRFIGFEIDEKYAELARKRVGRYAAQKRFI
ncbi:MAG: hypothetical protein KatS3mg031_2847 [Chitinophagales bacterium]|nr:MAG: hypothetical protein KatS3mg031_2847 [Chitinophagales bacterium]